MALVLVSVHCGVFYGFDDSRLSGEVTFTPSAGWMRNPTAYSEYVPEPVTAPIVNGEATVTLLAPTLATDPSCVYQVKLTFPNIPDEIFPIRMPVNPQLTTPLELSSRDNNQGVLDPLGVGSASDGGFGSTLGGFGG